MSDRTFIDTNILVYFISNEKKKKLRAKEIIFSTQEVYISAQVLSEFISVCLSKNLLSIAEITPLIDKFLSALRFSSIEESTIKKALQIKQDYNFSYWDSLVIASALENNCSILYTEDMQDGQIINDSVTIINPFKPIH